MEVVEGTAAEAPVEPTADAATEVADSVSVEPAPDAPADVQAELHKLEQRYSTLKGKYDSETQAQADQIATLTGQLQSMQAVIASMQSVSSAEETTEAPAQSSAALTQAEIDDYGEELLDVVGRKAILALNPTLEQINQRLQALEQGVGGIQRKTELSAREQVYAALNEQVDNWKDVNKSEDFKSWLAEADPYVGQQRGALLNQAFTENDAIRVVNFFKGYLKEQTAVKPGAQTPNQPATPATPQAAQVDLETLVAPGGATEAAPASAQRDDAGRYFTQAEISAFYADVQKGRYKGKDQEKAAIEQAIIDAANFGRIR